MELLMVGSGTCVPSLKRGSAGTMVTVGHCNILIDSGPGTMQRLLAAGVTLNDIDIICYTHVHPDHVAEMVPFIFSSKYGGFAREKELRLIGGKGFSEFFQKQKEIFNQWITPESFPLRVEELYDDKVCFDTFSITTRCVSHSRESIAVRIENNEGKSVVISGDTDYCDEIIELAKDTDLLVLECSHPEGQKCEGHLIPSLAGKIAALSASKELLLYHFYPPCDQSPIIEDCKKEYKQKIKVGEDLKRYRIGIDRNFF